MNEKIKAKKVISALKKEYPNAKCALNYSSPLELLIAARLSAQCTDKRVNLTTPELFSKFKSAKDFANAENSEVEKIVKPCGLYKTKSKSITQACKKIIKDFEGKVPEKMEDLTSLSGIGRKTANLVRAEIYGKPGIIVDTHFSRITKRLGFHNLKDPEKIEKEMKKISPEIEQTKFCHMIVTHGRKICTAKKPLCEKCTLKNLCKYYTENFKSKKENL